MSVRRGERAPKKPNTCSLVTANLSAGETTTENIADHAVLPDANNRKEHETQARHQTPRLPTMDSGLPRPIAATHFKIYFSLERLKLSFEMGWRLTSAGCQGTDAGTQTPASPLHS